MGKNLEMIVDKCKVKVYILEQKKETSIFIDIEKRPAQKDWLGKKVGDTYKLSKANITYRIDAIEDEVQQEPSIPPTTPPPPIRSKVFWVFQNQTYDEESYNGYIFAGFYGPHHWERLKEVRRGDIIIHSFRAEIVAVSIAKDVAYSWRRYDGIQGRRIDCDYYRLRRCISTSARKTKNIELCGGAMYQPFNTNGTGNQGYLYDMTFKLRDYYISEIVKYNPYILDKIPELRKYNTL